MQDAASVVGEGGNSQKPSRYYIRCRRPTCAKVSGVEAMVMSLTDRPTRTGVERLKIAGLRVGARMRLRIFGRPSAKPLNWG